MELDPAHKRAYRAIAREEARNVVADALSSIDDGETRRELLEAIGMVGLGAAAGGAGLAALAGSAAADASTSDGDGDVGTPGDRVDVFADGVDANSVTADKVDITSFDPDYPATNVPFTVTETADQTTTATGYGTVLTGDSGGWLYDIPSGYTLYANFGLLMRISDGAETVFARPVIANASTNSTTTLSELEISTSQTGAALVTSGWTEVTSAVGSGGYPLQIEGKVTGGTGSYNYDTVSLAFAGKA